MPRTRNQIRSRALAVLKTVDATRLAGQNSESSDDETLPVVVSDLASDEDMPLIDLRLPRPSPKPKRPPKLPFKRTALSAQQLLHSPSPHNSPNPSPPLKRKNTLPYHPLDMVGKKRYLKAQKEKETLKLMNPPQTPFSDRFLTQNGDLRYHKFHPRPFVDQRCLNFNLSSTCKEASKLLSKTGLQHTVTLIKPYVPEVVYEFYANIGDGIPYESGVRVFIRGKMYLFSPDIINRLYSLSVSDHSRPNEINVSESLDDVSNFLSGGLIQRWQDMRTKHLTPLMVILHGVCSFNWIPTTNPTTLATTRARLIYMIAHNRPFNFGKLVYDQVSRMADHSKTGKLLPFPNLIYQVLCFQRDVELLPRELLGPLPKQYVPDKKSGSGHVSGEIIVASRPTLSNDLKQVFTLLRDIIRRVNGGEYGHVPNENEVDEVEGELAEDVEEDM